MARFLILFGAALLAAFAPQQAEASEGVYWRVRDLAELLDPEVEARLAERLEEAERLYGPQVGIVTVTSLDGRPIDQFTTEYANAWGLGDADRDDGMVILIAPNERSARISMGLGIERDYSNAWAQEVMDKAMLPNFRQGDFGRGLEEAVEMIVARMRLYPTSPANDDTPTEQRDAA